MDEIYDFSIHSLGPARHPSPIKLSTRPDDLIANYVGDEEHVIYNILTSVEAEPKSYTTKELMEKAGPREKIYFSPTEVHAGIVTCGGLCPGLNDVIRAIVMCLSYRYQVKKITGIRFGFRGFLPEFNYSVIPLTPDDVTDIHRTGGTILGSSRGHGERAAEILDSIEDMGLNVLFVIGGDGTQRGALAIAHEAENRQYELSVIGVPKTIDNDLSFIQKSFGFDTAVSEAVRAVSSAHAEARGAPNGIGLVKVMGRESGFIAVHTTLAMNDVNFVLISEIPFDLEGPNGFLTHLEKRVRERKHAVVLVAEGAGEELQNESMKKDASGNKILDDIGVVLKGKISAHFKAADLEVTLKYIDPSYIIRSAPANPADSIYCERLGTNAVHAAMAGKTKALISLVNNYLVHVPIEMAVSKRNRVDPESPLWRDAVAATGQPPLMKNGIGSP